MPARRPEQLAKLKEYGFSDYASRAYLALLSIGECDARRLATASRVPLAKIYATLRQLHQKGLVEVTPESPKRYRGRPFAEFLEQLSKDQAERAEATRRDAEAARDLFDVIPNVASDDRGRVTVIRGRRNGIEKWRAHVRNAHHNLLILAADRFPERATRVVADLREPAARGVRARILAPLRPDTLARLEPLRAIADVRDKGDLVPRASNVSLTLIDHEQAFLTHVVPDDTSAMHGDDVSVVMDVDGPVNLLLDLVEKHWPAARRLSDITRP